MDTLRVKTIFIAVLTVILAVSLTSAGFAQDSASSVVTDLEYKISDITFLKKGDELSMTIMGNSSPIFTHYELPDPQRLVLDIAEASFSDTVGLPLEINQAPVSSIKGSMLTDKKPFIAKLEIFLSETASYTVDRLEKDILVKFKAAGQDAENSDSSASNTSINEIYRMRIDSDGQQVSVILVAGGPIKDFKTVELGKAPGKPDRIYIDLPGIKSPDLAKQTEVNKAGLARVRVADRAEGARVVFDSSLDNLFKYNISSISEGLQIDINPGVITLSDSENDPGANGEKIKETDRAEGSIKKAVLAAGSTEDDFAGAGYNRQRVSVDFYKTNIHNVFRLIREVSGFNVVVDDGISGQLTLALENVPWDFLLDVVLNLTELQKEERYNTLVISQKSKGFTWPERVVAKLEEPVEKKAKDGEGDEDGDADISAAEIEFITEKQSQSPQEIESKLAVKQGNTLLEEGKTVEGVEKYVEAFDMWPENVDLAKRIAAISLVETGDNERAVAYGKKALAISPDDMEAALQVAIGLAKMRKPDAEQFFTKTVSVETPAREALLSYAVYLEENAELENALKTLEKFEEQYEPTIDTRSASARIYDKMGMPDKALSEYRALLMSGKELDSDLVQYIRGRIALDNKQ